MSFGLEESDEGAKKGLGYGVANMQNHPVVDALHQIHEKASMVLPNCIQISKYKCTKQKGAEEIHGYGVANMQNHPVVDALHQIHEKARMVLPNWIQISMTSRD